MSQINTNWTQTETPAFISNKWAEPLGVKWGRSDLSWIKNIKQFYVKQKIGGKIQKWQENKQNKEHDKIIQYFPQYALASWSGGIVSVCLRVV
jgi:hypothetical protein